MASEFGFEGSLLATTFLLLLKMMNNHEFNTLATVGGSPLDAYVAFPEGPGPHPALLVLQEAFGVNPHIRNIAERLCAAGYAAVAPDLFHRTASRFEGVYTDFASVTPHTSALSKATLIADLQATYDWLQSQEQVIKDKIGSIGFCLGGRASFVANVTLPLAAGVSYYGGGLDQMADEAPKLHGAQLFFWGGQDKHINREKIDTIINAVKAAGKDYTTVTISYADHGFNCDERAAYHPLAAREAWAQTLAFLDNRLK